MSAEREAKLRAALLRLLRAHEITQDYYVDVDARYEDENEPLVLAEADGASEEAQAALGIDRSAMLAGLPETYARMGWHDEDDEEADDNV